MHLEAADLQRLLYLPPSQSQEKQDEVQMGIDFSIKVNKFHSHAD